ncbi:sigma-70 family RNA polymerase sigma factor [Lacticaseibacillus thailandensis]|uniref:Uncharacterized protein n=1 Tax=Lacticaseibacillus thailandensis DSM 22698 = JCM 13996 TaxID=1423810 RepID=A0A0R2CG51_9LACO|nr:sigma-70 family RNA polymerase sigma factor [Lacticaseibacillus thailandensis]KRM86966.1 hypothetical protein FD19_GL001547 [Lacticaseibacillus thailandensis DSM 22698 = JCM 13996]
MTTEIDPAAWQAAYDFMSDHMPVLYAALHRLHILPQHADYDDLLQEARLVYIKYYCRYHDPRTTPTEITKFNRLAGHFVYLNLLAKLRTQWRRAEIAPQEPLMYWNEERFPSQVDLQGDYERQEFFATLLTTLHAQERDVVQLRRHGLNNTEVASLLGLSRYQVIRTMRKVRKQALLLLQAGY